MLGLIALVACEKESSTEVKNQSSVSTTINKQGITLKDGVLIFEHEGYLQALSQQVMKDPEGTIKNFKAYFLLLNQIKKPTTS